MKREITISGRKIEYVHKTSKRNRHLRLTVYPGGSLVVSSPRFVSDRVIEKFLNEKADWIIGKIDHFKTLITIPKVRNTGAEYQRYKDLARELAENKVQEFNRQYNFKYGRITIRNQKSRWGSCSRRGNLSFSYRIALLPAKLSDYIIVHEICHLGEFNHSRKFWDLVMVMVPDYKERRKELRKVGVSYS